MTDHRVTLTDAQIAGLHGLLDATPLVGPDAKEMAASIQRAFNAAEVVVHSVNDVEPPTPPEE